MKQRSIRFIIGLMAAALLGVVAMQYYFIQESYRLKSQLFDQTINEVLNVVRKKIEKRDAVLFLKHKVAGHLTLENLDYLVKQADSPLREAQKFLRHAKLKKQEVSHNLQIRDSLLRLRYPQALIIDNDFFETYLKNPEDKDVGKVHLSVKKKQLADAYQNEVRELYVEDTDKKKC